MPKKMSEIDAQNDGDSSLTVTEAETKTTDSTFISEVLWYTFTLIE